MKCVGAKLRNAIGRDIWELESIEMKLNMEVVEEIFCVLPHFFMLKLAQGGHSKAVAEELSQVRV